MSLKKVLAVVMASAMAIGAFAAHALTLDVAEAANVTVDEVAVLADENNTMTWADFVAAVIAGHGNYDGNGVTVQWSPTTGCRDDRVGHTCTANNTPATENTPHRINNNNVQYQTFGDLTNLTVSNVNFVFVPADGVYCANSGWANSFTAAAQIQAEIQLLNTGVTSFTNCTFDKILISPWNATETYVDQCTFANVNAYALHWVKSEKTVVTDCTFNNCRSAIMIAADGNATEIVISGNKFNDAVASGDSMRGLIQFEAHGDYYNASITIANNKSNNNTPAFWQLNSTVAGADIAMVGNEMNITDYVSVGANVSTPIPAASVYTPVALVNGKGYRSLQEAIAAANNGDTVKVMPGTYSPIDISNKNITLEGTVADNGEILTEITGGDPAIKMHSFNGTIKNIKITNAWRVTYAEPAGNVTFDNIYVTGATYGLHLVAYSQGVTWNLQNSYIDLSWANSFGTYNGGYANINIKNNVFESTTTYYPDYGAPVVNSFSPNVVVEGNVFGAKTKIYLRTEEVAENATIGTNYYEDGAENAFVEDSDSFKAPISSYYEDREKTTVGYAPVFVGDNGYYSVQEAINAANNGDIIEIQPGTYEEALRIEKSVTLKGVAAKTSGALLMADEKPVIIIKNVSNGGVQYYAPNVKLDNIKFVVAEDAICSTWNVSAVGYYYENTVNKDGLTITNCDFVNESDISMSAIAANIGRYTVTNNTFKNFTTIVHSFVDNGAVDEVVISGNRFEDVETIANIYYGAPEGSTADITVTNNKSTDGSKAKVIIDDYGMTKATPESSYDRVTVSENDSSIFEIHNYSSENFTLVNEGSEKTVYFYRTKSIMERMDGKLPNGVVYVSYAEDFSAVIDEMYIVFDGKFKAEAETVKLIFKPNTSDAEALANSVWDMYLVASDGEIINRLNSGDFTFVLDSANKMAYEIIASNDEVSVNNVAGDRYEFHYDGKTNTETDTALEIKIATVKFTGYGTFTFSVDTTANATNVVHATTYVDNIVDSYTVGTGLIVNTDTDSDEDGVIESEIAVPTRKLTINVAFPNEVEEVYGAHQQMTVKVSGGDLAEALVYDLGSDVTMNGGAYAVVIEGKLTKNIAYNVEVSGAGYRTARYTVTMTDAKTLNFWNNVKDNAVEVETGKASSAVKKNFLAGDIVADNNINIYDLSAVVSYFATNATTDYAKYVKYDLNRDGKIDSKDVAYVLVSWGK